jgi:hypothetical protein
VISNIGSSTDRGDKRNFIPCCEPCVGRGVLPVDREQEGAGETLEPWELKPDPVNQFSERAALRKVKDQFRAPDDLSSDRETPDADHHGNLSEILYTRSTSR